jgi:hypothetical protein
MLRITELKLPLSALPVDARRAADAPSETDEDRRPTAHPLPALTRMAAQALGVAVADIQSLQVFKRSFDARKADLLAVLQARDRKVAAPTFSPDGLYFAGPVYDPKWGLPALTPSYDWLPGLPP